MSLSWELRNGGFCFFDIGHVRERSRKYLKGLNFGCELFMVP